MAVGGVPWGEMSRYCEDHGIAGPMRLRWIRIMRALDATFLIETGKKREAKRGSSRSRD